jgi:ribosomal protein RSM22 (predicted rRNA methylase)
VGDVEVWQESAPPRSVDVLLISHALTEQPEPFALPCEAEVVIIVEPGTREVAGRLVALRERLRGEFHVVAPCTHQAACGMLAAANARHWCHHFAPSPPEVFMDGDWARFAKLAGIDLRRLPVSYLVLDRRAVPTGGMRMIGRPRVYKAHALVLGCDADGVRERRVEKRSAPDLYRQLKKGQAESLWREMKTP